MLLRLFFLFFAFTLSTTAQLKLKLTSVNTNWPTVNLKFKVTCDGVPTFAFQRENFVITENGVPVNNFTISCADAFVHCPVTVALVFDASGSMSSPHNIPNDNAIAAGHIFLEDFVEGIDEAAILWFNSTVTLALPMTTSKYRLESCIDTLPAVNGTALWEGLIAGVQQVVHFGSNKCRAVVLLTDGMNTVWRRNFDDAIDVVVQSGIKVFTVGLGSVDSTYLKLVADTSGGRYFHTDDPVQLRTIYSTIAKTISMGDVECDLNYNGTCIDDSDRTVNVRLSGLCSGIDSATISFHTPGNIGKNLPVHCRMTDTTLAGGLPLMLHVNLVETLTNDLFYPFETVVSYDTSLLVLKGVETSGACLLPPVQFTTRPVLNGAAVRVLDSARITGNGKLFSFLFDTVNPSDTACTNVSLQRWTFDDGCMAMSLDTVRVCLIPCRLSPKFTAENGGMLCFGDSITLEADSGFASYEWFRNGAPLGLTTRKIMAYDSGWYYVRVSTASWCSAESPRQSVRLFGVSTIQLGDTLERILEVDKSVSLPVTSTPAIVPGSPIDYNLSFLFDDDAMSFEGVTAPPPGVWNDPLRTTVAPGVVSVASSGVTTDTLHILFTLRFHSRNKLKQTESFNIDMLAQPFNAQCLAGIRLQPYRVMVEGICDRIVMRKAKQPGVSVYPNPVSGTAHALVTTGSSGHIVLSLCDASGRVVRTLIDDALPAGRTSIDVDINSLQTGVYFLHLAAEGRRSVCPLTVVR
jgi:hypothetical protein